MSFIMAVKSWVFAIALTPFYHTPLRQSGQGISCLAMEYACCSAAFQGFFLQRSKKQQNPPDSGRPVKGQADLT
jgi:hypothetical protein